MIKQHWFLEKVIHIFRDLFFISVLKPVLAVIQYTDIDTNKFIVLTYTQSDTVHGEHISLPKLIITVILNNEQQCILLTIYVVTVIQDSDTTQ
jgi:hypothetical protein